ncbi:hypothetical protein AUEXF2481DRAFT_42742 [Aureobasidium subglaciale EXF-2481]|uniref:Reverse transcriptase domain-containing protein n=1 Tax=Aureobasidium subglaciale (strain EXF-2481) TaxID=1043005 RepID=A0A074YEZ3_AURSE|nr:uncharacterized protein AUEXF2481DRAFT_42742 [Aureobasidium subglaciale EXF-2481]KAI5210901.1 hypothetical protein E4T38_01893 [Aureobasidium subglaciale]KAI5229224.1 hypothetical protein E4T40_01587 [Aureobasidium subglaciale]KAI5233041.1 hypothetical protein E4T41_01891 [Aureobasidium subglaciale]KAI5266384.1 hypothetical protein E4T46_01584 [Aureobasidium subglaciale]KEQ92647.1 hypothetical protein AUEXF2481DRAFT_42742 [Aureobasidium subglaciale EXF-2481]
MASRVLRDVTNYKRSQLADRRKTFEERKAALLVVAKASNDPISTLADGLKKLGLKSTTATTQYGGFSLSNLRSMLKQATFDASIPSALPSAWRADLERLLDIQSNKYEYTDLFSRLATEWVDKPNDANILLDTRFGGDSTADSSDTESFESVQVGRDEMYRQRQEWDSFVFTERQTDTDAIEAYLTNLFVEPQPKKKVRETAFESLHRQFRDWTMEDRECSSQDVELAIKSVLKADLLSGRKRDELIALGDAGKGVLAEIADVINMEIANLGDWSWKPSPTPAQMRKQLNGKYRVYMDPEIHQALLLQYLGTHLAVHTKTVFKTFFRSRAWPKSAHTAMTSQDRARHEFYLGRKKLSFQDSLLFARREQFKDDFFLTQLPETVSEGNRDYNGSDDSHDEDSDKKSPLEIKQTLLRLGTTELMVQRKIYGSFTLCQTDFKWFGPSLPHSTIFAVLKFLGFEESHIEFFKKYLSMSLVFPQDGPNAEPRTRRCGVPISQTLSDMFGETVLACLDFAVSKATSGRCQLYRFHDDVWFWGQKADCEVAWEAIKKFTDVMGMALNEEKTGSVHVSDNGEKPSSTLPKGAVRWGFLVLDPVEGRWVVDMANVDLHIAEMRLQFAQCRSIFSYVQAWNSYMGRFLGNNFGQPANCLGLQHLDMIFSTFKYIQKKLFVDDDNVTGCEDVTSYLKSVIEERFGTQDIANVFLYWPVELGGLELRNPFIPLMTARENSVKEPKDLLEAAFERDEEAYDEAKRAFEKGSSRTIADVPKGCDAETFFSFEDFVRFREETSAPLKTAYDDLLDGPGVSGLEYTRFVEYALKSLPLEYRHSKHIKPEFVAMDVYWRWTVQLYGAEAMERFGGLGLGEKEMLPVELVNLMRSERVRWQG